jgi:beta-glucosidase-like glycosyl hydrolase/CubicO group peptidase (beta-lactamase class C family)
MKRSLLALFLAVFSQLPAFSQQTAAAASRWADSVLQSLTLDQKIAQLLVVRLSSIDSRTRTVTFYEQQVDEAVRRYNVGGICLFQGGPVRQASLVNYFQAVARTPILISIDGETGVGMRVDSVQPLPRQMMLGAMRDPSLMYRYGEVVAEQCHRMGIQVNYAPVVDVNNNPDNPVINDRSFGEQREKVAAWGIQYMRGMQDNGVMAVAKHFPGHGDVSVDSHHDLPVINKSRMQLDSLELYPFRALFRAGVGGAMIAHLSIPAIDPATNRATSLSSANVSGLLRKDMGFEGLAFTDALEMKGVSAYYPDGQAAVEALVAGNDMLCLPGDVPAVIAKIKYAIRKKRIRKSDIDLHVRRVLLAKYAYGLSAWKPVPMEGIAEDLGREIPAMRRAVAEAAITLARHQDQSVLPVPVTVKNRIAVLSFGVQRDNAFAKRMRLDYNADVYCVSYQSTRKEAEDLLTSLQRYDAVLLGIHNLNRYPANRFGMGEAVTDLVRKAAMAKPSVVLLFGNPYAARYFADVPNLLHCYEDGAINQEVAADILEGKLNPRGALPVTVNALQPAGTGLAYTLLPTAAPASVGMSAEVLQRVDSLAEDAVRQHAAPGCVVLVARQGRIVYHKAFGFDTYDSTRALGRETIFDMASVTKICATTLGVMKLYDQGRLDLDQTLGHYLPWVRGSDKASLRIRDILLHQAGLKAWIPFYRETIDTISGLPKPGFYAASRTGKFQVPVANSFFLRNDWRDTMYRRILQSPLEKPGTYVYSDNDFIFLGKIIEAISGLSLDQYVRKEFYDPLGLTAAGFLPLDRFPASRIAPTEREQQFRRQLIRGHVHDPGAAMFGGVAGHAGLFSDAYDIAVLMQMLLNNGVMNGRRFLSDSTVERFTAYGTGISRRGLGFDKPERDNTTRKEPYPTLSASARTFGHTGFTGTCAWADPETGLVYIFLSNRVHPDGSNKLLRMNVRSNIHETLYQSIRDRP